LNNISSAIELVEQNKQKNLIKLSELIKRPTEKSALTTYRKKTFINNLNKYINESDKKLQDLKVFKDLGKQVLETRSPIITEEESLLSDREQWLIV
jgi:hypothetical protein